jgi:aspartate kinase
VAGFQGQSEGGDATTLGRGGSDTSAVALAVALGRRHLRDLHRRRWRVHRRSAHRADRPPHSRHRLRSMLEMSSCGSKVLALRCVEYAQRFGMPLHVRSSFSHRPRHAVVPEGVDPRTLPNI